MIIDDTFFRQEDRGGFTVSVKRKKIWAVQLKMLSEIDDICRRHGLKYYAANGTMLGAVKYNGFVPWDDDMDIMMPRPDYEKFKLLAAKELQDPYYFQDMFSGGKYIRLQGRVRNRNTTAVSNIDMDRESVSGIFIDVFPIDGVCHNKTLFKLRMASMYLRYHFAFRYVYSDLEGSYIETKLAPFVVKVYTHCFGYEHMLKKIDKLMSATDFDKAGEVYIYTHNRPQIFPKALFGNAIRKPFEQWEMPVPEGYDRMLKKLYGADYLTTEPSDEEKGLHHTIFFDPDKPYSEYCKRVSPEELIQHMNDY